MGVGLLAPYAPSNCDAANFAYSLPGQQLRMHAGLDDAAVCPRDDAVGSLHRRRRWAMTSVVRCSIARSGDAWTMRSHSASSELVVSSSCSSRFFRIACTRAQWFAAADAGLTLLHSRHQSELPDQHRIPRERKLSSTETAISQEDRAALVHAIDCLTTESFVVRAAGAVGSVLTRPGKAMPKWVKARVLDLAQSAIKASMLGAAATMRDGPGTPASTRTHKALTAVSGAAGGMFGLAGAAVEVPFTTTLTLRAIADIARSEGFDVKDPAVRVECATVLSMGSDSPDDDEAIEGYFTSRSALAHIAAKASEEIAKAAAKAGIKGLSTDAAGSWVAKLVVKILERFGIPLGSKLAAGAVPVISAVSAATLNTLFTDYYQTIARGHFITRRLENKYGQDAVRAAMQEIVEQRHQATSPSDTVRRAAGPKQRRA